MRKTIGVIIVTALITGIFYSCSKKAETLSPSPKTTISQEQFLDYMAAHKPTKVNKNLWVWLKTICADIGGALSNIGNGTDAMAEGYISASLFCGFPPPGGTGSNPYVGLTPSSNWTAAAYPSNPYDYAGQMHNLTIYQVVTNSSSYLLAGSTNSSCNLDYNAVTNIIVSTCSNYEKESEATFEKNISPETVSGDANFYYYTLPQSGYSSVQDYQYANGKIDAFVDKTMNEYISTISNYTSASQIYNYSVGVEKELIASDASATDKQILLTAFSVARYSSAFWGSCGD